MHIRVSLVTLGTCGGVLSIFVSLNSGTEVFKGTQPKLSSMLIYLLHASHLIGYRLYSRV